MKLIEFGPSRANGGRASSTTPRVVVSRNGSISLNPKAMEVMGLIHDSQILFCQDPVNKKNWFIKKTETGGFRLRKPKGKEYLLFMAKDLSLKIHMSVNSTGSVSGEIGSVPIEREYWPILLT